MTTHKPQTLSVGDHARVTVPLTCKYAKGEGSEAVTPGRLLRIVEVLENEYHAEPVAWDDAPVIIPAGYITRW